MGELLYDLPNKRYHVQSTRVIRVAEEVHKRVYDARCDFAKLDSGDVDGLDKELAVLWGLFGIGFLGTLELFLEEQDDFFDVAARGHAHDDAESFSSDFDVGAETRWVRTTVKEEMG